MVSQPVLDAMNNQINHELYSAYFYLSMSASCETANLPGFAAWLRLQAQEEQEHAMKFYEFILDRGGKVTLQAIPQPPIDFASPLAIFEQVYQHEQKVTALINKIYDVATSEKDVASQIFLQWFITEQVEEEKNASQIVDLLQKIGPSVGSLYQLDHNLGKRGG
ncbi:MAG: ferritin [Anaerolineaceae bacterium]|nr:ferritin [Anaerolineaceae bacterium]